MAAFTWSRPARGFTLIELMVTVVVLAILAMIALPSFISLIKNSRLITAANEIQTIFAYARSEAVTRRLPISVCSSADGNACDDGGWQGGLLVFTDGTGTAGAVDGQDEILKYIQFANASLQIYADPDDDFGGRDYAQFKPNGQALNTGKLVVCDDRGGSNGHQVSVFLPGRTETSRGTTCS